MVRLALRTCRRMLPSTAALCRSSLGPHGRESFFVRCRELFSTAANRVHSSKLRTTTRGYFLYIALITRIETDR
jgi:hypothetical protein